MNDGIRFSELLEYNAEETGRWKNWFAAHPSALDLTIDIAEAGTVRRLLGHIFLVELHYSEAVLGNATDFAALQKKIDGLRADDIDGLFALSDEAARNFHHFLSNATAADYETVQEFGRRVKVKASKRKLITQALTHSMRHWAQLATGLRQQGMKADWVHDFLLSRAME